MKDNFDDILKRKLAQQHFPVDASHRQEMIEMLGNQKRRKAFPFWWFGSLLIAGVIAAFYVYSGSEMSSNTLEQGHDTEIEQTQETNLEVITSDDPHDNQREGNKDVNQKIGNTAFTSSVSDLRDAAGFVNTVGDHDINKSRIQSVEPVRSLPSSAEGQDKTPAFTIENKLTTKTDNTGKKNIPSPSPEDFGTLKHVENDLVVMPIFVDEAIDLSEAMLPRSNISFDNLEALEFAGLSILSKPTIHVVQPFRSFNKSMFIFGEAGIGLVFGSKPDYNSGWRLNAGAGIGYRLTPKSQLSWSAGYLFQNGGFDFQRLSSVNQPGFGARSSFNTLTPDKLHFVYSKLGVQTRAGRNVFAAHAGIQWLYGAQGSIIKQEQAQLVPGVVETSTYSWLQTSGLRQVHWTADVAYGYQMTPRLSIFVGADYYFSSFTIEDPSLVAEGYTWSGAYSPLQPFLNINYLLYGRL